MRKIVALLVTLFMLLPLSRTRAQTVFTDLKSLRKRADYYYSTLAYVRAADLYTEALKKKKNKQDYGLNIKAACLYMKLGRFEDAKSCYNNILQSGQSLRSEDSIRYFNTLRATGDLKADTIFRRHYSRKLLNNLFRDTLYYNIYHLPSTELRSEYCPIPLNNGLLFVSEEEDTSMVRRYNALNNGGFARLYYAQKTDSGWSVPEKLDPGVEKALHVGPLAFYDNNTKAIINMCIEGPEEPYRLGLYSADFSESDRSFRNIIPLPFNNRKWSTGHPAVGKEGKKIFFISDMPGGIGGTDIYYTENFNGQWTTPKNLGPKINTKGDEKYPFLTEENILFFSSDGRYGIGGLDIYYADLDIGDSMVVNMGYPVNSSLDDFGFCYDKSSRTGYFSSNRQSKGKEDDLYMYTENRILLDVTLLDDLTKEPLKGFTAEIQDTEMEIPVRVSKGQAEHLVNATLRPAHNYRLIVKKENYRNDTLTISTYGMEAYVNRISKTLVLQRRPVYFASLKLKNDQHENFAGSVIAVNNMTEGTIDTIAHDASVNIRLMGDCEYIITAKKGDKLKYIYVEKKSFRITASIPYYNLYLGTATPSILHVKIKSCEAMNDSQNLTPEVKIADWVNRNEFKITPGPEGDFQLVVTDQRLFDLFVDSEKVSYTGKQSISGMYCIQLLE